MSQASTSWFACDTPRPDARLRVIGFPHGGGGPQAFREWGQRLPDDVELVALSLPGRGSNRFMDAFVQANPRRHGVRWSRINWDNWDFEYTVEQTAAYEKTQAQFAMPPEEGVEDLERILEQRIAPIYQDVLGVSTISEDENFFELGGDSLLASQILLQLRRQLPNAAQIQLHAVFDHPTVREMAAYLVALATCNLN